LVIKKKFVMMHGHKNIKIGLFLKLKAVQHKQSTQENQNFWKQDLSLRFLEPLQVSKECYAILSIRKSKYCSSREFVSLFNNWRPSGNYTYHYV